MGTIILNALLGQLQSNPDRAFALLEDVIALLKAHPELVAALIAALPKGAA